MVPKSAYPPHHTHPHLTTSLSPSTTQSHLSAFLAQTPSQPHLHPDSLLSTSGITYSAHSGPSGGLAIHHLRRIEAGLRGEDLGRESLEELARFGEEVEEGEGVEHAVEEDVRVEEGKNKKRKREREREIADWASDTYSQAAGAGVGGGGGGQELESFAATPVHHGDDDWEDQESFERKQRPWKGDIGEREGAPVVRQNGRVPGIKQHDDDDDESDAEVREVGDGGGKGRTEAEKRARKAAKKARKLELAREKAQGQGQGQSQKQEQSQEASKLQGTEKRKKEKKKDRKGKSKD